MQITVERQNELLGKYGSEYIKQAIEQGGEAKDAALGQFLTTLANLLLNADIHPDDVEDVSTLVGPRFGLNKSELPLYAAVYYLQQEKSQN